MCELVTSRNFAPAAGKPLLLQDCCRKAAPAAGLSSKIRSHCRIVVQKEFSLQDLCSKAMLPSGFWVDLQDPSAENVILDSSPSRVAGKHPGLPGNTRCRETLQLAPGNTRVRHQTPQVDGKLSQEENNRTRKHPGSNSASEAAREQRRCPSPTGKLPGSARKHLELPGEHPGSRQGAPRVAGRTPRFAPGNTPRLTRKHRGFCRKHPGLPGTMFEGLSQQWAERKEWASGKKAREPALAGPRIPGAVPPGRP